MLCTTHNMLNRVMVHAAHAGRGSSSSHVRALATSTGPLRKSPLHAFHEEQQAKMGGYAGWDLPLQYKEQVKESHLHTRAHASIFDVSHMQKLRFHGDDRAKFFESVTVADLSRIAPGQGGYTLIPNEKGGIIDDAVFNLFPDHIYMVVNAGCAAKDLAYFEQKLSEFKSNGGDVEMETYDGALIALQGPTSAAVLSALCPIDFAAFPFMQSERTTVGGIDALVTRCGYTGEDGFEIGVSEENGIALAQLLCAHENVLPAGLAVRDTLRLEAGLCLYGNDLDEETSPIEAGLNWTISKRRRAEGGFPGFERVAKDLKEGVSRKRVGFKLEKGICREGAEVQNSEGDSIGRVCSGTFSPCLEHGIGMAYVSKSAAKVGTPLSMCVRKRAFPAAVTKMPFVATNYFSPSS
eukprot:TRINITY_DN1202_c0_g3_i2.p1 TRINITY_DN1202_c0_g3~~TRINITY_DN1202_c0_g3_i2.p1  ORF type:complete len:408 (+),score=118.92 TRINITY_DN1202_c0_g3_i2:146-1369(+)